MSTLRSHLLIFCGLLALGLLAPACAADAPALFRPQVLLGGEYWGTTAEEGYLDYLAQTKPDLIHAAVTGPELASCVFGQGKLVGITTIYPGVNNMKEYFAWWKTFNTKAHKLGIKVQATHSLTYAWGDQDQNTGFFKYYNDLWEADVLGPKPAPTPNAFLRIGADGKPIRDKYNDWYTNPGCLNNPIWRQLQKQLVKSAIDAGFDGFMVQFPYFDNRCVCEHCQAKFRAFLAKRFTPEQLKTECGIDNLATYKFDIIGSPEVVKSATPSAPEGKVGKYPKLDLAAREFGAICVKDCFDDIFVDYGRKLKPDLVLSMWMHFRQFVTEESTNTDFNNYLDERTLLPIDRWGKGENYVWYSSPVYTGDPNKGFLGDSALDGRVLRAMSGETAFEILKYDYHRWRLVTGESLALGGICFNAWKGGWSGGWDPETVKQKVAYYNFIRANQAYLNPRGRESYAQVGMLYPRQALFAGDAKFFGAFRDVGRALLQGHVLFDAIIDQKMTPAELARRQAIIVVEPKYLTAEQQKMLQDFAKAGGKLIVCYPNAVVEMKPASEWTVLMGDFSDRAALAKDITNAVMKPLSTFSTPREVEIYADRQAKDKRVLVHYVNFARDGKVTDKEAPIAAAPVNSALVLPAGFKVKSVTFRTPEATAAQKVPFKQTGQTVQFTAPGFLVYGLIVIQG